MCRETGPSPSHCSLGAGWDAAGGGGEGGFSQHLTGKRLVAVCDGARQRSQIPGDWPHRRSLLHG